MSETLTIQIDLETKKRLDAIAKSSERSTSLLAAEAITAFVQSDEWRMGEILQGIEDLDNGHAISHEKVADWLNSWGKQDEAKAPR